ncbi:MAG: amino acid adenylation domain-containing protein, partial [Gammaproteobacteria bacterium]|nr:amino acid adenylation domain-containing protein [Gammaproteobacteria bacterium]
FVLHNLPLGAVDLPALRMDRVELDYEVSKFDLVLHATEKEGLELSFEYSTELFDSERIARLANYFELILEVFTGHLNTRVSEFELLTEQERCEISKWNTTDRAFPQPQFLHHWFENQAHIQPQSTAVSCGCQTLTYKELDSRANQLAHWLCSQGVGIEVRVGICMERSVETVVGILAILKAGGAYVPITPANPDERIASLLVDCGAQLLLTQERLLTERLSIGLMVFCLDRDWGQVSALPTDKASFQHYSPVAAAAYVIYTSGSTGSPKGVIVTHENAVASTWARFNYYQKPLDGFLLVSPLAFDSSVAGIFWTLSLGGHLCIPTEEELQDLDALAELVEREKPSHLLCLPSFYALILEGFNQKQLNNLQTVIVAGETCLPELVANHYTRLPNSRLYNEYGPTESSVWSSVYAIRNDDSVSGQSLSIGRPIANTRIFLLDNYLNPVPIGVSGELYIGGAGLTRGYLGRPDLTAERFVPNPFSQVPGNRLYKTGDLARYRSNGNIEFLGRTDHQVKIRGFRIELGEIESQIVRYPGISEALVVAREERGKPNYLLAYWVAVPKFDESSFDIKLLSDFLKSRLPDYMIPSVFVRLEQLPRTATGKVDRKSLPSPDCNGALASQNKRPRTATEKRLAKIWAELLQIEHIGIDDNFFSLGGDSILVIQMVSRVRHAGLYLNPQQLSQHQTIAELAEVLTNTATQANEIYPVEGEVPLTPNQHWFFEQCLPNPHHWNSALMLEAQIPVDSHRIKQAVDYLLDYHDALRLRFTQQASGWHQSYAEGQDTSVFHQMDLSGIDDAVLSLEIEKQASIWQQKLNITKGPLIQVVLFNTGNNRPARLFMVIHHLAVDGVSWRIILDDLHTLYQQSEANQTLSLPPKTTSYQQWSNHLQTLAQSAGIQEESDYWVNLFAHKQSLPLDKINGKNTEGMRVTVTKTLGIKKTKKLLHQASTPAGSAIDAILLAALTKTLSEWSKSPTILMDVDLHGRVDVLGNLDFSRSVGWFTSVFPVLICFPDDLGEKNTLSTVKKQLLKIPNKGINYGVLRYLRGLPPS